MQRIRITIRCYRRKESPHPPRSSPVRATWLERQPAWPVSAMMPDKRRLYPNRADVPLLALPRSAGTADPQLRCHDLSSSSITSGGYSFCSVAGTIGLVTFLLAHLGGRAWRTVSRRAPGWKARRSRRSPRRTVIARNVPSHRQSPSPGRGRSARIALGQ